MTEEGPGLQQESSEGRGGVDVPDWVGQETDLSESMASRCLNLDGRLSRRHLRCSVTT